MPGRHRTQNCAQNSLALRHDPVILKKQPKNHWNPRKSHFKHHLCYCGIVWVPCNISIGEVGGDQYSATYINCPKAFSTKLMPKELASHLESNTALHIYLPHYFFLLFVLFDATKCNILYKAISGSLCWLWIQKSCPPTAQICCLQNPLKSQKMGTTFFFFFLKTKGQQHGLISDKCEWFWCKAIFWVQE